MSVRNIFRSFAVLLGMAVLLVSLPGSERSYSARGRDSMLLDFAEALSDRLVLPKR